MVFRHTVGPLYLQIWNPWIRTADCTSYLIWGTWAPMDFGIGGGPWNSSPVDTEGVYFTHNCSSPQFTAAHKSNAIPPVRALTHNCCEAVNCSPSYMLFKTDSPLHPCWILVSIQYSPNNIFPTFTWYSSTGQHITRGQVLDPLLNFFKSPRPNTLPDKA